MEPRAVGCFLESPGPWLWLACPQIRTDLRLSSGSRAGTPVEATQGPGAFHSSAWSSGTGPCPLRVCPGYPRTTARVKPRNPSGDLTPGPAQPHNDQEAGPETPPAQGHLHLTPSAGSDQHGVEGARAVPGSPKGLLASGSLYRRGSWSLGGCWREGQVWHPLDRRVSVASLQPWPASSTPCSLLPNLCDRDP